MINYYDYPEYIEIEEKKYKINTDFRVALQCDEISRDTNINELMKITSIIYLLFGDDALDDYNDWEELFKLAIKYLKCGKEDNEDVSSSNEPDMSFKQDWKFIEASFMSDYGIDLSTAKIHWWRFFDLIEGLTEDSVLNRVRFIRNYDISQIKDQKERNEWVKRKQAVELKREKTLEEIEMDKLFDKLMKGE